MGSLHPPNWALPWEETELRGSCGGLGVAWPCRFPTGSLRGCLVNGGLGPTAPPLPHSLGLSLPPVRVKGQCVSVCARGYTCDWARGCVLALPRVLRLGPGYRHGGSGHAQL